MTEWQLSSRLGTECIRGKERLRDNQCMTTVSQNLGSILLVEDDEVDVMLISRAFDKAGIPNPLKVVHNGAQAIAYLSGTPPYHDRDEYPLPETIFLDLHMPLTDGLVVLEWIRSQPAFDQIRIVALSGDPRAIEMASRLGANSTMQKVPGMERLTSQLLAASAAAVQIS